MRRLVLALLVLVGLLVGADFAAAAVAESAVSGQVRQQLGMADDPSVRINGFPFLTQAISGNYPSVEITAERVHFGELRDLEVRAELHDVAAPLSELLGSGPKTLRVQRAFGSVRISAADLELLLPGVDKVKIENVDDDTLDQAVEDGGEESLSSIGPDSAARITGTVSVPVLGKTQVAAIVALQIVGGQVQVVARDVRVSGGGGSNTLPAPVQRALRSLFTVRIDPGTLPFKVEPIRLRARDGTLELTGTTSDLVLGSGSTVTGAAAGR